MVNGLQVRTESTVDAEHPPVYDRPQGEVVKDFAAPPPHVGTRVLSLALVVKAVNLSDLTRLVVPADEGDAFGVANFESEEEEEGLYRVEASVDEIA